MNFIQPLFLWGLTAVTIPIIIHLFDFRRTKKVYFSNTKLLQEVKEATRSFYSLKHLLILLTRILFIVFLVGAFAQPYLSPRGEKGLVSDLVGIYIDNSLSMSNLVAQDETGLSLSKRLAEKLVDIYPSGTQFIVQTSFDEKSIYAYMSGKEAKDYFSEIEFTPRSRALSEILSRFNNNFSGSLPQDILLISDFQESSGISNKIPGDTLTRLIILPITMETYNNVVIDTAFISNPLELDAAKRTLQVKIRNFGNQEIENLPIKIFKDERQLSVTSISVGSDQVAEMSFNIGGGLDDQQQGKIILDDYPVSFDNELFFNLQPIEKIKVAQLIDIDPSPYVNAVYGNTKLFEQRVMSTSNIEYQVLEEVDLIVLNQLTDIDPGLAIRINEQINLGASLLIIPGENVFTESFRLLVNNIATPLKDEVKTQIQAPDFSRPFFKDILERTKDNLSMPAARISWSWGSDRNALLKLIDGSPYLSEVVPNIYVFASPLTDDYSDLQTNALFVPIMYRIANNRRHNIAPLFFRLNTEEIVLPIGEVMNNQVLRLVGNNKEFIPEQKIFGSSVSMLIPGTSIEPGHYKLLNQDETLATLALNANSIESNLRPVSEGVLKNYLSDYSPIFINGTNLQDFEIKISNEFEGILLWRYFLAIALLFLLIEALLIRIL